MSISASIPVDRTHGEQEFELSPSHKPQRSDADPDARREDRPQSCKAGHQSRTGSEDDIYGELKEFATFVDA